MNRFNFVAAIFVASLVVSCYDTKENLRDPVSEKDLYRAIGEEIPFETGMEWIEFYKKERYHQGRLDLTSSFSVTAPQVDSLLKSADNLVGIAFHHAIDEAGEHHIIVIPVDESMSLWSDIPGRLIADANTGQEISRDSAAVWAQRYKEAYPNEVWFHFFGKNVFDEMVALPFFDSVDIEPAINVLDLTPQLLLVVVNNDLVASGRTAATQAVVYDASNACPPCAVR